jgi:hypothetical protein
MRDIDIQKRPPWYAHLFAVMFALSAALAGWYLPQALMRLSGEDPWDGWTAIGTAFVCLFTLCVGFCFGLLFGYGIALRLSSSRHDSKEDEGPPVSSQD